MRNRTIGKLTLKSRIISDSGLILLEKGQIVTVSETIIKPAYFAVRSGTYYPERISGIKLKEIGGVWNKEIFVEFN